jgi:hypothetical protein
MTRIFYLVALVLSIIGVVFSGIAYFAPFGNTGVDGSIGALLALVGAVATAAGIVIGLATKIHGPLLTALNILVIVAAILTSLAAYFLLQFVVMFTLAIAAIAVVIAISWPANRRAS